jgi:catechol-2,3-dioxygenase
MNTTPPFVYTEGNDPPADPATKSYFSNHIGLLVSDLTATRQWYSDVLGMRHIFTVDVSPSYSVMYMGHSQGGKNGSGYQTGQEMARDRGNLAGLVEFIWNKVRIRKASERVQALTLRSFRERLFRATHAALSPTLASLSTILLLLRNGSMLWGSLL